VSNAFESIKAGVNQALEHAGVLSAGRRSTNEVKITKGRGGAFLDIGFQYVEAKNLPFCTKLVARISAVVDEKKFSSKKASKLFGLSEAELKDVLREKTRPLAIDVLVNMLARVGLALELNFASTTFVARPTATSKKRPVA
jgi:predicted XRE-type DNA-binding protein